MKKILLILAILPLLSCAKSKELKINDVYQVENKLENENDPVKKIKHDKWNSLLQQHVTKNGIVNYVGFQKDAEKLDDYLAELSKHTPQKNWTKEAVLAYWINAYNAFTIKLILNNYPTKSIKDIKNPWGKKFITLGNKQYSLEEIEHEILRKMDEPRIHFAINCASFSCPNLANEAYVEEKLNSQLELAAKSFINDATKNSISEKGVKISKIFDWFSGDFKNNTTLIEFLNQYSEVKINNNTKIKFIEYNWNLNE